MNGRQSRSDALLQRYRMILEKRKADPSQPLSVFCRAHKIKQWTYFYWKKKLSIPPSLVEPESTTAFIPVTIPTHAPLRHSYEIHFGTVPHIVLRSGFDPREARTLVDIVLSKDF